MTAHVDAAFWSDDSQWPYEPPGYVFLLRAVGEVGSAMYPGEWTGRALWWEPALRPHRASKRGSANQGSYGEKSPLVPMETPMSTRTLATVSEGENPVLRRYRDNDHAPNSGKDTTHRFGRAIN